MADIELVIKIPEELYEQCKETELTDENEGFVFHIINTVAKGAPTEEVQPIVHGEWLNPTYIQSEDRYEGECSICHKIRVCDYFCSSCGAIMKKESEEEE